MEQPSTKLDYEIGKVKLCNERSLQMNRRILSLALVALIALLVITVPAVASTATDVSGTMAYAGPFTNLEMKTAGENCIIDLDLSYAFEGDMQGIAPFHFRVVSHGACPVEPFQYSENLKARGTFDGKVWDKEGSLDLEFVSKAWPADPGELALVGKIFILSGTGELANLHGLLDVSYIMGNTYDSYSGQFHFDP
jgi:hypothetical protein